MAAPKSDIHLYTAQTPNGIKASILLEELGLPYETHTLEFSKNEQKEPWFLEINPNGRIPAMTDVWDDGKPIRIFESGSMLQYLVDRYDKDHKVSYPHGSREHWETTNWVRERFFSLPRSLVFSRLSAAPFANRQNTEADLLRPAQLMWQMGGLGPMQGQANHFKRESPPCPSGRDELVAGLS